MENDKSVVSTLHKFSHNRWTRLTTYSLATLLTTCIYYGWQQYRLLLYDAGAWEWDCPEDTVEFPCDAQREKATAYYSAAAGTEYLLGFVAGILLDNFGPRACGAIGEAIWGAGLLLQFFASESFNSYIAAAFLLGAGVNLVAFPTFILEELFPAKRNLVISLMIATQTAATAIAPISWEIVKTTDITAKQITAFYFIFVYIPVAALYIWTIPNKRPSKSLTPLQSEEIDIGGKPQTSSLPTLDVEEMDPEDDFEAKAGFESKAKSGFESKAGTEAASDSETEAEVRELAEAEIVEPYTFKGFIAEILTVEWILFFMYYQFSIAGFNIYTDRIAERYGDEFSEFIGWVMLLQCPTGILLGLVSDYTGSILVCGSIAVSQLFALLVGLSTSVTPQYISGLVLIIMQSWIWTTKYCFVAEIFGRTNFGKLVGLIGCASGIVTYMNAWFAKFGSDEMWFGIFAFLSAVNIAICAFLYFRVHAQGVTYKKFGKVAVK